MAAVKEAKEATGSKGASSGGEGEPELKRPKREDKRETLFSLQKVEDVLRVALSYSRRVLIVLHTNHTTFSGLDASSQELIQVDTM